MSIKNELTRLTGVPGRSIGDVLDSMDSLGGGSLPAITPDDIGKVMTATDGKTVIVPKGEYNGLITVISDTLPAGFVEGAKLVYILYNGHTAFTATVTKKTDDRTYLSCEFIGHGGDVAATVFEDEDGGLSLQGSGTLEVFLYNFQKGMEIIPPQTVIASGENPATGSIAKYNYDAIDSEYAILVINGEEMAAAIVPGGTRILSSSKAEVVLTGSSGAFYTLKAGTYTIAAYTASIPAQWKAKEVESEPSRRPFVITDSGNFSNPRYSANYDRIAAAFNEDNTTQFIFQVNSSNSVEIPKWVYTTPVRMDPRLTGNNPTFTFWYVAAIDRPDTTHINVCLREVIFSANSNTPTTTNFYFES